jgi:hypothetical protein
MKTSILIISISIIAFFTISNDKVYSQEQAFDEFMEWCEPQFGEKCAELYEEEGFVVSETNYNSVIVAVIIVIALAIMANYFWSKRKGRSFSQE